MVIFSFPSILLLLAHHETYYFSSPLFIAYHNFPYFLSFCKVKNNLFIFVDKTSLFVVLFLFFINYFCFFLSVIKPFLICFLLFKITTIFLFIINPAYFVHISSTTCNHDFVNVRILV